MNADGLEKKHSCTNVKKNGDIGSCTIGLHQGSVLSPYLFTLVMDELTRHIQNDISWCMLFVDDIV
ncbi:hypothetical protein Scep_030094 [Stephania cephalantha]|uniref:Reverse transcriptase domain-containing protein n=1 Tax=Stephania cephalantha TaxID=152367 RepID=A0AAP0HCV9_9MAGN